MTFLLEKGKTYRTRNGQKATMLDEYQPDGDLRLSVENNGYRYYKRDGTHGGYSGSITPIRGLDIVAEWEENTTMPQPKKGSLLADLAVRKGDVVRLVWSNITKDSRCEEKEIHEDDHFPGRGRGEAGHGFEIVSRANPVTPETLTPKKVSDMTNAELGSLVRNFSKGESIEFSFDGKYWHGTNDPSWNGGTFYRLKPAVTRQETMLYIEEGSPPCISGYMSDPTHKLAFVWENGKLADIELEEVSPQV